ncbi:TIGR00266 family protein [Candidatus Parvarchaeota archaeon]|nr:TIGR00266 family protein [Candidatus Parvarchaeota archaeon]
MKSRINGTTMQTVSIELEAGESVYAESGAMAWMSDNIDMVSEMRGGLGAGIGRLFTGESLFLVNFTAQGNRGFVTFASDFPGKIMQFNLKQGESIICQKDAFLLAQQTVQLKTMFRKKLGVGLFGGEGFILQEISGPGTVFVALDGEITELVLKAGQRLKVDTGCIAMMEPSVKFDVQMQKGVKNMLFGGEGLFLATVDGPGKVWLQSMPVSNLAAAVAAYIPRG